MRNLSSEELIEIIKKKDTPGLSMRAEEAFKTFTYRHQLDLMKKLIPICKGWGYDEQVATEIAYQTFERVWKYPKYDSSKTKQTESKNRVLFYLYGIAKRLLIEYKKDENEGSNPFSGDEEIIYNLPDIEILDISADKKAELEKYRGIIMQALEGLSTKHRIIYLTYKQYESELNEGYRLPRKLLSKLRDELKISQNTIRSYKKEAFDAVSKKLESND